jgi:beta-ureidopropionase
MNSKPTSRRSFLRKSSAIAGSLAVGTTAFSGNAKNQSTGSVSRLPREVWIASVSQMGINAETPEQMTKMLTGFMNNALIYQPDIFCLPEVYPFSNVNKKFKLEEKVEISLQVVDELSVFSKQNNCYLICPVYTVENGNIYNSAVVIDRMGKEVGKYHKMFPTEGEIAAGISPGPLTPPVFKTDFGTIGIQICFDLIWDDGWKSLGDQGAEIVFFPAAYAGGQALSTKAWEHKYAIVSSTRKNTTKICDISGDVIAKTGTWDKNLVCAPVNLEKAFLHTWPAVLKFEEIRQKYGNKIKITNYDEEEWSVIESRSPDIFVNDILKEFDLNDFKQHKYNAEVAQNKARKNS